MISSHRAILVKTKARNMQRTEQDSCRKFKFRTNHWEMENVTVCILDAQRENKCCLLWGIFLFDRTWRTRGRSSLFVTGWRGYLLLHYNGDGNFFSSHSTRLSLLFQTAFPVGMCASNCHSWELQDTIIKSLKHAWNIFSNPKIHEWRRQM